MNSLRAICIAGSILLAASYAVSDDLLKKGKDGGGSSSSQGGGSRNRNEGSRGSDNGSRMRDGGSRNSDQGRRSRGGDLFRPGSGRNQGGKDLRPGDRFQPKPTKPSFRPGGGDDFFRPGSGRNQRGGDPRPGDRFQPKPVEPNLRPGGGDDLFRPGSGRNQGGGDVRPGDRFQPKPVEPGIRPRGDGDSQLGRIDNPQGSRPTTRPGSDGFLGRKGGNSYGGGINNLSRDNRNTRPISIDRAPIDIFRGGLQHQVRREDNIRIVSRGCRVGYYHYYDNWCDDNFWFSFYIFDPFRSTSCFVSPWYYYPHLPGYISPRCVTVINFTFAPWYGTYYNWHRPYGYDYDSASPLDYAVDDIQKMFERVDERALRRLLPYNDRVAIFIDGEYSYSMEPDDFEKFMLDNIDNTRTVRYEITRVERRGREAQVEARHEYEDPWGRRTTVYHSYRLELDRGNYVITRFGTSYFRD